MLEIVFDCLVCFMIIFFWNFILDNVEVLLDLISLVCFGDYFNLILLLVIFGVFKVEEWDGFGLIIVEFSLIYLIIDVFFGGGWGILVVCVEGWLYIMIEINLV